MSTVPLPDIACETAAPRPASDLQFPAEASAPSAADAAADAEVEVPVAAGAVVVPAGAVLAAVEVVVEVVEVFEPPPPHPAAATTAATSEASRSGWGTLERMARFSSVASCQRQPNASGGLAGSAGPGELAAGRLDLAAAGQIEPNGDEPRSAPATGSLGLTYVGSCQDDVVVSA
jgi:hypothetical protein